jgi:arylsulfatase A-like enzyme
MNIILLISDTFRYDNLFGRAAMPVRTPQLQEFARRAVSLDRMYVSSFPTIPHRTDLTTGRCGWPWYPWQDRRTSSKNHLPLLLNQAGYVSQLICDCPHLFNSGFQFGFDPAVALRGQEADIPFLRMNYPIDSVMPPEKTRTGRHFQGRNLPDLARWVNRRWYREEDRFPAQTARLAVEWLEENYRWRPFFLWVDFFDPHEPWDPPEYLVRKYDPGYTGTPMIHPNYGKATDLARAELRNLRAHYSAEAELVDRWVGRVLQKIDDLGLWDNSIVIFTTDHGMSLGEHNRTGKSNINDRDPRCWPIYPEIAHIPFLVAAPGLKGGRTVEALLQPTDILPTLLDLAGLAVEPPEPFHGRSFAPMLRGKRQKPLRDAAVTGCHFRRKEGEGPGKACTPVLYTRQWAYVPLGPKGGRPELYALGRDPYAEKNVVATYPRVVRDLHARLIGWMREVGSPDEAIAAVDAPVRDPARQPAVPGAPSGRRLTKGPDW